MPTNLRSRRGLALRALGLALASTVLLAGCSGGSDSGATAPSASAAASGTAGKQVLLDAQQLTVLDQQVVYPKKVPAQVSSSIVQLEPGQETGWHKHNAPMYAYVLEGSISVEYDAGVTKDYAAGTALLEAQRVWHNGTNKGDVPVRILVVNMGAEGVKNSVERAP